MLFDLTLKLTPEMANAQGVRFDAPAGHFGTHFDVMNKEFPLSYTRRDAIVFHVRDCWDREITCGDISLDAVHADMFVGFCTGYLEKTGYGTPEYHKNHPVLSYELIDALIERKVSIIGIDFAGVRRGKELGLRLRSQPYAESGGACYRPDFGHQPVQEEPRPALRRP